MAVVHNARVFANSCLCTKVCVGKVLQVEVRDLKGVSVPVVLVGVSGNPLTPWLMRPYAFRGYLTNDQKHFNYCLSMARIETENAFS